MIAIGVSAEQMHWLQSIFKEGYYKKLIRREGEDDYSFYERVTTKGTGLGFEFVKPKCEIEMISLELDLKNVAVDVGALPPSRQWRIAVVGNACLRNVLMMSNSEWEMDKILLALCRRAILLVIFLASSDLYPWEISAARRLASDAARRRHGKIKFLFQGGKQEELVRIIEGADTVFGMTY